MTDHADLQLLGAAVELTEHHVHVDVAEAWALAHGREPARSDWTEIRLTVLRLEREGLVTSDPELRIEPTAEGRAAVTPTNPL